MKENHAGVQANRNRTEAINTGIIYIALLSEIAAVGVAVALVLVHYIKEAVEYYLRFKELCRKIEVFCFRQRTLRALEEREESILMRRSNRSFKKRSKRLSIDEGLAMSREKLKTASLNLESPTAPLSDHEGAPVSDQSEHCYDSQASRTSSSRPLTMSILAKATPPSLNYSIDETTGKEDETK